MMVKKVALFCDFLNSVGGTEYYNVMLATELKKRGIDVRLFVGEKTELKYWTSVLRKNGIKYYEPEEYHQDFLSRTIEEAFMPFVIENLKAWKPDIIHCSPAGKMFLAFVTNNSRPNIPIVATEYTTPSTATAHWYQPDLPKHINQIDALIATCKTSLEGIKKFHKYTGHVEIIRHFIKHKGVRHIKTVKKSVGCVARFSPEKGVGFLIGAWQKVIKKQPAAKLYLYGHGPAEDYLKNLTKSLGLENNVCFCGVFSPNAGIGSIVNKHTIFVQPSIFESISTSTIELMGYSKAIIATNAGGTKELINKKTGILVPVASTDALARNIIKLLEQPSLCRYYGTNARRIFMSEYDVDVNIFKLLKLYKNVINKQNVGRYK